MRPTSLIVLLLFVALQSCFFLKKSNKIYAPEMVYVPAGTFLMGDVFERENTDALPVHIVEVSAFYIGRYEITFEQYDAFAQATGRPLPDDRGFGRGNRSVSRVTWDDALAFCRSLGYRLPTEEEWEYAARSGGKEEIIAGTADVDSIGHYAVSSIADFNFSLPGGTRRPNGLGLYDMSGNLFEWIGDFYQFYSMPDKMHDQKADAIRILRGGSFTERNSTQRTYWRVGTLRDVVANDIGFRCVADA